MNPLQGSGVSERSRCGAVRILELADEPSTGIGRVGALSLWCRASSPANSLLVAGVPDRSPANPLRGSVRAVRILELADEPSTGIGRVGALIAVSAVLAGGRNPLRGSGVSDRSRCGAVPILELADEPSTGIGRRSGVVPVRILELADEPSTGIGRVGALSLWCRANP